MTNTQGTKAELTAERNARGKVMQRALADEVRTLMAARGMSVPELARASEIPVSTLRRLLTGGGSWTLQQGEKIANGLPGVRLFDLIMVGHRGYFAAV